MKTKTLVKTDRNGTKYFKESETCYKCNGSGVYHWGVGYSGATMYSGVCYACHGSGVNEYITKEYTPEHQAKLDKDRAKREAKRLAERAERQAEIDKLNAEIAEERAKEEALKARSNYVGSVGEKIEVKVTLTDKITYEKENFYGYGMIDSHIYKFIDSEGNIFSWFTGSSIDANKGDAVTLKATVKKHNEYNNAKETILTRCKILREEA